MNNHFIINDEMHIISQEDDGIWRYQIKKGDKLVHDREVTKGKGVGMLREFFVREIKKLERYL